MKCQSRKYTNRKAFSVSLSQRVQKGVQKDFYRKVSKIVDGIYFLKIPFECCIMKNEINNKRQDVGNGNSLHPYAGDETSHTAYNAPNPV